MLWTFPNIVIMLAIIYFAWLGICMSTTGMFNRIILRFIPLALAASLAFNLLVKLGYVIAF